MGILSGNPQNEPMHYGEIFDVWSYLLGAKGKVASYQIYINHAGDKDLRKFLENVIQNTLKSEIEELENLLKVNGIQPPPAPPEKPMANLEDIPAGAKFSDPEIAATVGMELAAGLVACSQAMGKCTREDIALMFGRFHLRKSKDGATLLRLSKDKAWLVPPPLQVKHPEPVM